MALSGDVYWFSRNRTLASAPSKTLPAGSRPHRTGPTRAPCPAGAAAGSPPSPPPCTSASSSCLSFKLSFRLRSIFSPSVSFQQRQHTPSWSPCAPVRRMLYGGEHPLRREPTPRSSDAWTCTDTTVHGSAISRPAIRIAVTAVAHRRGSALRTHALGPSAARPRAWSKRCVTLTVSFNLEVSDEARNR